MKRRHTVVLATMLATSVAALCVGRQQGSPEIVSSFKEIAARHVSSYQNDHRVRVALFGRDRWRREWFDAEPKYSVDVQSTNSLISPYVGIFEFRLRRYLSKMWDTKEQAEKDTTSEAIFLVKHKHTFAYQDKKWVATERKHFQEEPKVLADDQWWNCDETLPDGKTNISGCFENMTLAPTPTATPKPQPSRRRARPF